MSDRLIQAFLPNSPLHLEGQDGAGEGDKKTLWKVVLRTGTWKLRPGPGGQKLDAPLKIYRDKAPKGHLSLAALKKNFDDGAKENVTIPVVHADGTTSDSGFVRRLVIQDVAGEDGSKSKESLLWAEMDITDSEIRRKVDEKSLVGVSGGVLFDYERTEDAKKYDQILSHVMVTNSPWINGTGGFTDKLPEGVMASESADLPISEVEFQSAETDPQPHLPEVKLDDPSAEEPPEPGKATGKVVWKPEQGLRYVQDRVQKTLREWRETLMASIPSDQRYSLDWPYYKASDVTLTSDTEGTALICSGYGSELDTWVAGFKFDADRDVEIEPFAKWTPAKQEWVAASEDKPPAPPAAKPAPVKASVPAKRPADLTLSEAQAARAERIQLGTTTATGGHMGRLSDLLSRADLSEEDRELIRAEEARIARLEEQETERQKNAQLSEVVAYCGSPDGSVKGKLDELQLGDPGIKKYVRNVLMSDDGGAAIELSEVLDSGQKTTGVPRTASDIIKGFIDVLPKDKDGRVSLSEQARRLPDDPPPPAEHNPKPDDPKAGAEALLAEMNEQGFGFDLVPAKGA
jgi:hypothetical protein